MLALLAACADGDAGGALRKFSDLLAGGADVLALLDQCIRLVRDLLVVKTCGSDVELVDVFGPDPKALAAEAEKLSVPALVAAMGYLVEARSRARWAADGRPVAELAVVRLASLAEMEPLPEVLARLDRLQQLLSGGSTRPAAEAQTGEKKKHGLSENEGRVPGEAEELGAEPPDAPPDAEAMPPDQKAEGQEATPLPPREPAKRRKLDEAMMDPLIQKAIRLFDGRIVNIED
jgi:DNA polymerase-3 subunit gamma/tau